MDSTSPGSQVTGMLLSAQVATYLRRYISENALGPDDSLPGETEISRTLGISRPIVREAAHGLAALGVIRVAPGRRPRVARVDGEPMRSMFEHALSTGQASAAQMLELREGIEVVMAVHAAARRSEVAAQELEAIATRMGQSLYNRSAYAELDLQFHMAIAAATGNPFYTLLIEGGQTAFIRTMLIGLRSRSNRAELQRVQKLHETIVRAIVQQDEAAARNAMTRHFDDARAALVRMPLPPTERKVC